LANATGKGFKAKKPASRALRLAYRAAVPLPSVYTEGFYRYQLWGR